VTKEEVFQTLKPFIEDGGWIRPVNMLARIRHLYIPEIRRVFPGNSRVSHYIAEHPNPPSWEWDDYWICWPVSYGTCLYATLALSHTAWNQGKIARKEMERVQVENAHRTLTDISHAMAHYEGRPQKELDEMWARFERIRNNQPKGRG